MPIFLYFAHFNFAFWYLRIFSWQKCYFTKIPVAPLFMVRFSKFNLSLKLESKLYNKYCALQFCDFAKNAKLNGTRNLVDLQYTQYSYTQGMILLCFFVSAGKEKKKYKTLSPCYLHWSGFGWGRSSQWSRWNNILNGKWSFRAWLKP